MSKRIVVGLDGSPYAASAVQLAIRRAQFFGSTLIGVSVIDSPNIEHVAVGAQPGALYVAKESVSAIMKDAKRHAEKLIEEFRNRCEEAGVSHEDIIYTGIPCEGLLEESKTADMIVIGIQTFFHYPFHEGSGDTLRMLLEHPIAPVLAVTQQVELPQNVIIAYDGSPGAARALQAYLHVTPGLPEAIPVTLLCVASDYEKHKHHLEKASLYLRSYGIESRMIVRSGTPEDVILSVAKELYPAIVIIGSPVYKGLAERLFGSVVEAIINNGTVPVFVFH